jgi:hypothetical protein
MSGYLGTPVLLEVVIYWSYMSDMASTVNSLSESRMPIASLAEMSL